MNNLVQFRADPNKVRVSIRPCEGAFRANVASRITGDFFWSTHTDPKTAIDTALGAAESFKMEGIDLGMEWSYKHPMKG